MKAQDFLKASQQTMDLRGKDYDKPEGERSMAQTVQAFKCITGAELTEAEGWLFMQILKDVRQWQKEDYHHDSALDCVAYAALKGEALSQEDKEYCVDIEEEKHVTPNINSHPPCTMCYHFKVPEDKFPCSECTARILHFKEKE